MFLSSRRALATDGSAQDGVATWAVYIPGVLTATGEVLGEDTEAFRAEIEAILQVLRAAAWASQRAPRHGDNFDHITILYDSLSVVTQLCSGTPPQERFQLWLEARHHIAVCRRQGWLVKWHAVPAHGRIRAGWTPPPFLTEQEARYYNEVAHRAAVAAQRHAARNSQRPAWHIGRRNVLDWTQATLEHARRVHASYCLHLEEQNDAAPLVQP